MSLTAKSKTTKWTIQSQVALGAFVVALFYGLVYSLASPIRVSDPDQYYHYSVAKHFSDTLSIKTLPQVKGLGWDDYFENKEFLFHAVISVAYKIHGESGVHSVIFLLSLGTIGLIYFISLAVTKDVYLSAGAALLALLSDAFLLRLVLVRPHVMGMFLLFLLVFALVKNWRFLVFVAAALFTLSYHAWYVPLAVLALWQWVQWLYGRSDRLWLIGLIGLFLGTIANPYFPSNYVFIATFLKIIVNQASPGELDFGKELEPFRTDHFLFQLRMYVGILAAGLFSLFLDLKSSPWSIRLDEEKQKSFFFFGITSFFLCAVTFISPRVIEYFVPTVCVFGALVFMTFYRGRQIGAVFLGLSLLSLLVFRPFGDFKKAVARFQQFDQSYFSLIEKLPETGLVFNCDWWGGEYLMYARPKMQVIDVLDPSFLREADRTVFTIVENIRKGRVDDPLHFIKDIIKSEHVLCSSSSGLSQQLLEDDRFVLQGTTQNMKETVYLFGLRSPPLKPLQNYLTLQGEVWAPAIQQALDIGSAYFTSLEKDKCLQIKPRDQEEIRQKGHLILSGSGDLTVYLNSKPQFQGWSFPEEHRLKELILPVSEAGEWSFRICPRAGGVARIAAYPISQAGLDVVCASSEAKTTGIYSVHRDRCDGLMVKRK